MALNLARVQGRWSMTLASGARDGSRGWRLVTVTPGRPGHQPAGTMTGARGASLEVPHRLAGNPPRELVCHGDWPRVSVGMNSPIGTEPWWDAEWRARFAKRAPHREMRLVPTRVVRRSASFFLLSSIVAQSTDREATGPHRRHSLAKIGAESREILVA